MEITNSQTCFPSLVTSDMDRVCAPCREAKLGVSKMPYLKLFFYFPSLLADIFLWEDDKRFEFMQFNNQTFYFVPKSGSRSLLKKRQWKNSVKNCYIILHFCYPKKENLYKMSDKEESFGIWGTFVWLVTGGTEVTRHLLFWSCELLFLHLISINLVLFLQRFYNISRFMKINDTTLPRVSGDYTDSYTAPATSVCSFTSEFSLHFVSSLLLFHLSAF